MKSDHPLEEQITSGKNDYSSSVSRCTYGANEHFEPFAREMLETLGLRGGHFSSGEFCTCLWWSRGIAKTCKSIEE